MTNLEILHHTVSHYLRHNFRSVLIESEAKVTYMLENALRISLGRSYDHVEYCLYLADHGPNYGVIAKDHDTLTTLKQVNRAGKWKHTKVSNQVQIRVSSLDINTQVLVLMNASNFSSFRIRKVLRSWTTEKPVIFIG